MMTGRIMLRDGRSVEVNVPDYEHPAAAAALRSVRDFDVMQGPFGRPRGPNRTAADPVTIIDVGSHIPRAVDYLITSPAQYAPDRFVRMAAEGLLVPSSVGRRRLHPAIYPKEWTGQNDKRNEAGGFLATALRVISPEWRAGPREAWAIGHYWRTGHAHREAGEPFVCRHRDLAMHMAALRDREGADRVVVERVIRPAPTAGELAINGQERVNRGFIVTSHETPLGNGDDAPWIPSGLAEPARPPPDG
jgi:hypothetical protein